MDPYPKTHFPGTATDTQKDIAHAIIQRGLSDRWQVPLEVIHQYEPNQQNAHPTIVIEYVKDPLYYGSLYRLLRLRTRGPGEVLRHWIKNPAYSTSDLAQFYRSYRY